MVDDKTLDPNATGKVGDASTSGDVKPDAKVVPISALHEEREKRQAMAAELQALKQLVEGDVVYDSEGRPMRKPAAPPAQPQAAGQEEAWKKQLDQMWETDPRKAVELQMQGYIGSALNWYDQVNANLELQEDSLRRQYPDYDEYRGEARKYLRTLRPEDRAKEGVVQLAYLVAKGQNSDKIVAKRTEEVLRKIQAGESIQGFTTGTMTGSGSTTPIKLTEDQRRIANAMGMSEDDYIKNMPRQR
jgi:hypothetical protein